MDTGMDVALNPRSIGARCPIAVARLQLALIRSKTALRAILYKEGEVRADRKIVGIAAHRRDNEPLVARVLSLFIR